MKTDHPTIEPRIAERRRVVAEGRARGDLRRFLWLAALVALIGLAFWILTSPWLSVDTITVFGAERSEVRSILAEQRVVDGRPLVAIRPQRVAEVLEADPWVRAASVELVFPDAVEVTVEERKPTAWLALEDGWALVGDDGVVVAYRDSPTDNGSTIRIISADPGIGMPVEDPTVIGLVDFLGALPAELGVGAAARITDGELWALVAGRNVRLGRAVEMTEKAAAVAAVIEHAPEGVIDVIAPARPTVWGDAAERGDATANPQPEVEGDG